MARRDMFKTAEKCIGKTNDRYDMTCTEFIELCELAYTGDKENIYKAIDTAWRYGYVMGGRAVAKGDKAL